MERAEARESQQKSKRFKCAVRPVPDHLEDFLDVEFNELRELCKLLKPFDLLTKKLSEEQSTASSIIPAFKNLQNYLRKKADSNDTEEIVKSVADLLHQAISERYDKIKHNNLLRMSMLVDPRFAYDEEILSQREWFSVEDELFEFCKSG